MKRTHFIILLVFLFIGGGFCADFTLNHRFLPDDDGGIIDWRFNPAKQFQPLGKAECVMQNGQPGVKLTATEAFCAIYAKNRISAKPGDKFSLTGMASGKGKIAIGFYMYSKGLWRGSLEKWFNVSEKNIPISHDFEIKSTVTDKDINYITIMIMVKKPSEVTLSEFCCKKQIP
ncbi:MAG: hypothetical protein WCS73_10030 [Lentisphaeria bacterium]